MPIRETSLPRGVRVRRVAAIASVVLVTSASGLVGARAASLVPSGTITLTKAGAVVEGLDVTGTVYVRASNITIRQSRVTSGGHYLIRIDSGVTGTVVENVQLHCGSTVSNAMAFGRYTARFVDVTGPCKNVFLTTGGPIIVESSTWNGSPMGSSTSPPVTSPPVTSPPVTSPPSGVIDGTGYPNATTTGVPAGTKLIPSGSVTITQDGTVIENLEVTGTITIDANDVVIRRTRVIGTGLYGINHRVGASSLIEDVEIVGVSGQRSSGISPYGSWTARRVNVHGFQDGIKVNSNQTVERSYIHDLLKVTGSHNDGIQSVGGTNVRIIGNRIDGPFQQSTSALILQADVLPLSDYVIEGNLLSGGTYTVYVRSKTVDDPNPTGMVFRNNVWVAGSWKYGSASIRDTAPVWEGNRFSDGSPFLRS